MMAAVARAALRKSALLGRALPNKERCQAVQHVAIAQPALREDKRRKLARRHLRERRKEGEKKKTMALGVRRGSQTSGQAAELKENHKPSRERV